MVYTPSAKEDLARINYDAFILNIQKLLGLYADYEIAATLSVIRISDDMCILTEDCIPTHAHKWRVSAIIIADYYRNTVELLCEGTRTLMPLSEEAQMLAYIKKTVSQPVV